MTQKITIRKFRKEDAADVHKMMVGLAAFHGDFNIKVRPEDFARYCSGRTKMSECILAFCDGKPVGFAACFDRHNFVENYKVCCIDLLYVEEEFRRYKIGLKLTKRCLQDAVKRGCKRVYADAEKNNEVSNNFYPRHGFQYKEAGHNRYSMQGDELLKAAGIV